MLDIAIQIVNYNTKSYLIRCLDDLLRDLRAVPFSWAILVLDNDSDDDLSDLASAYGRRNVKFLRSERNRGFGAGHNFLARQVQSRNILILNPDLEFVSSIRLSGFGSGLKAARESGWPWSGRNS